MNSEFSYQMSEFRFPALFDESDTLLMGRKTFAALRAQGAGGPAEGKQIIKVLPAGERSPALRLVSSRVTPAGTVMLLYSTA